jgi:hypothetical protein
VRSAGSCARRLRFSSTRSLRDGRERKSAAGVLAARLLSRVRDVKQQFGEHVEVCTRYSEGRLARVAQNTMEQATLTNSLVVGPVVMAPLEAQWAEVKACAGKREKTTQP